MQDIYCYLHCVDKVSYPAFLHAIAALSLGQAFHPLPPLLYNPLSRHQGITIPRHILAVLLQNLYAYWLLRAKFEFRDSVTL